MAEQLSQEQIDALILGYHKDENSLKIDQTSFKLLICKHCYKIIKIKNTDPAEHILTLWGCRSAYGHSFVSRSWLERKKR